MKMNRNLENHSALGGLVIGLVGLVASFHSARAAEENALEEVVVTAQKREERLIDVPMSITAISGDELQERGLNSIQDLSFAVPGMATRPAVTIRQKRTVRL